MRDPLHAWDEHLNSRLSEWRGQGLRRERHVAAGTGVRFDFRGRSVLSFASNDYLGLAAHPAVIDAAKRALEKSGAGAGASPLISGHKSEHHELERELARFKRSEAALVFPSGYQASLATLAALAGAEDAVILDRLAHASLIDGAQLSRARVCTFRHNDPTDLKRMLDREQPRRCLVAVESLYSMDGDLAPLGEIVDMCEAAGALLLVDEAHATGVLGRYGQGALEAIADRAGGLPKHILAMGTLSKALGSQGGFLCASQAVVETILHAGRAYVFSTALAPAAASAALAALRLIGAEPERREHLLRMAERLRLALSRHNLAAMPSAGPIIPVLAGDEARATSWKDALFERGIYVPAIRYPTVKKGQARLRISLSASHTDGDCDELINGLVIAVTTVV